MTNGEYSCCRRHSDGGAWVSRLAAERRIERQEARQEAAEKAREEFETNLYESSLAAIALGEATAKAVQRIPDAHCNGDMHAALDYAAEVKHKQRDFVAKRGISAIIN